jgi:hypothetical protein
MALTGIISGVRAAGNGLAANQKPDIDSTLRVLQPYQTPLTQFMFFGNKTSMPVINKHGKFSWFEDELYPYQALVTAAITESSGLTLDAAHCANFAYFKLNDLVYIEETDEMAKVTTYTAGTSCVLTHVDGSSTLTSLADTTAYLKIIGSVNSENGSIPTAQSTEEVEKYNYLTIMSESVASTGRDQAGENYTDGTSHDEQVQKKMLESKIKTERFFMLSRSAGLVTTSGIDTSYGKGMLGFYTSNLTDYSGALDEDTWDDHLSTILNKGTNMRDHYCGGQQYMDLQKIVKDKIGNLNGSYTTAYGVRYTQYIHAKGDVRIIWNPVLDGKFTNWGITVDPATIKPRHMANDKKGSRKFRIENNVETPGTDRTETKLLMDIGFELHNEETGGVLYQT